MSSKSHSQSFPYRDIYRDRLMDAWLPEDVYDYNNPKKLHINKYGSRVPRTPIVDDLDKISGESWDVELDNGLIIQVTRKFKKPLGKKALRKLNEGKNFSKIREEVKIYEGRVAGFEALPQAVRLAIGQIHESVFKSERKILNLQDNVFYSGSVKNVNLFLRGLNDLADWILMPDENLDERLHEIPKHEWAFLPWIKRTDRRFKPHPDEDPDLGKMSVSSETGTFLFPNSSGMRIRKIFAEPLENQDYEDYKKRRTKTILFNQAAKPRDLFDDTPSSLLEVVDRFQFYPVFMISPYQARSFEGKKLFPYMSLKRLEWEDPKISMDIKQIFGQFGVTQQIEAQPYYETSDDLLLTLVMREIQKLEPHRLAMQPNEFYERVMQARTMHAEEHDRFQPDF